MCVCVSSVCCWFYCSLGWGTTEKHFYYVYTFIFLYCFSSFKAPRIKTIPVSHFLLPHEDECSVSSRSSTPQHRRSPLLSHHSSHLILITSWFTSSSTFSSPPHSLPKLYQMPSQSCGLQPKIHHSPIFKGILILKILKMRSEPGRKQLLNQRCSRMFTHDGSLSR